MRKDTVARAVSGSGGQPGRAGKPRVGGTARKLGRKSRQIDNIRLELDAQRYRTTQLETLLRGIKDDVHELIELVKWLQHEVLNKPASIERTPRNVLH
jgi:hypothetical protein